MSYETRVGIGYDVHALTLHNTTVSNDEKVMTLCGLRVPSDYFIVGHSDADVGLHALTDALLGAIAAGDIGMHFSPNDAQWKGKNSSHFLQYALKLAQEQGARIVNVDVTLVCEVPKIGPYRDAMRARIAVLLGVEVSRVSVKATTTEKLGYIGRKEGIAAQAVASVELPFRRMS